MRWYYGNAEGGIRRSVEWRGPRQINGCETEGRVWWAVSFRRHGMGCMGCMGYEFEQHMCEEREASWCERKAAAPLWHAAGQEALSRSHSVRQCDFLSRAVGRPQVNGLIGCSGGPLLRLASGWSQATTQRTGCCCGRRGKLSRRHRPRPSRSGMASTWLEWAIRASGGRMLWAKQCTTHRLERARASLSSPHGALRAPIPPILNTTVRPKASHMRTQFCRAS